MSESRGGHGQDRPLEASVGESRGYWRSVARRFRGNPRGTVGFAVFALLLAVALLGPLLANSKPIVCRYRGTLYLPAVVEVVHRIPGGTLLLRMPKPFRYESFLPKREIPRDPDSWALWAPIPYDPFEVNPVNKLRSPRGAHLLGTDEVGRDVLSRMVHATSVSLLVGFLSMGIASLIGVTLGALAGYMGGWVDIAISRLIEMVICFPTFFLILSIMVWLEPDIRNVMIVIGLTAWTGIARLMRGEMLKLKTLDYATAARALGAGTRRVVFRHLLPNGLAPVLVVVTFGVASAIFTESALSWLGFGVMPPTPSWGNILRSGFDNLRVAPHLIFPPCAAIFLAILALNFMGDALRDVTDPRLFGSAGPGKAK